MTHLAPLNTFEPSQDRRAFRNALGRFATGITIVTTNTDAGPVGITVNSFSSVSLDPPLVLWSPAKQSNRYDAFINTKNYAVHVLGSHQKHICDGFTKSKTAFENLDYAIDESNIPIISGCIAVFKCEYFKHVDAGDHSIIIGRVIEASERLGPGLTFSNGVFGTTDA